MKKALRLLSHSVLTPFEILPLPGWRLVTELFPSKSALLVGNSYGEEETVYLHLILDHDRSEKILSLSNLNNLLNQPSSNLSLNVFDSAGTLAST